MDCQPTMQGATGCKCPIAAVQVALSLPHLGSTEASSGGTGPGAEGAAVTTVPCIMAVKLLIREGAGWVVGSSGEGVEVYVTGWKAGWEHRKASGAGQDGWASGFPVP